MKLFSVTMAICLTLVLAACSSGTSDADGAGTDTGTNTDTSTDTTVGSNTNESNFSRGSLGANDSVPAINCDSVVSSTSSLEDAAENMSAGTTVCLADGNYNGLELSFSGLGTANQPVTIAAQNPGAAVINGDIEVAMSGEFLVLQGLVFRDGTSGSSNLIQTRGGNSAHCNYCRITENTVIDMDVGGDENKRWLKVYGSNNRIDHNWFSGKTTGAVLLEVVREEDVANRALNTTIDHNYFGDRPPVNGKAYADSSDNEFEAIRIGFSGTHEIDAFTTVEYNYFERIDGEAEVISNKAGSSTIQYNTIRDSYGSLTTRHGANALINGNVIIGDDHPFAGGLRIVDGDHTVTNNYIEGARYNNTLFHGGIVLHKGQSSTVNGYQAVENVLIAYNTIVNSVNSLNVEGGRESVKPSDIYLVNNIIAQAIGPVITQAENGLPTGNSSVAGNTFFGQAFSDSSNLTSAAGISFTPANLSQDAKGLWRPVDGTNLDAATSANLGGFVLPSADMDGQERSGVSQQGADHISSGAATVGVLNSFDVGPIGYRPAPGMVHVPRIALSNHDFDNGDADWSLINAEITSDSAETFSRGSSAKVTDGSGELTRTITLVANTIYTLSAFTKGDANLKVELADGSAVSAADNTSDYRFNSVVFNSGSNASATIIARPNQITDAVVDGSFTDFRANGGNTTNWTTREGDTIGDVGSSANTASGGDGSARLRYRTETHAMGSPGIMQTVGGVIPNTNYQFTMYVKRDEDAAVLLDVDLLGDSQVIAENLIVNFSDLDDSTEIGDNFRRFDFSLNSGANTSIDIHVSFVPQGIDTPSGTIELDGSGLLTGDTDNLNEIRVDDIGLTYEGTSTGPTEVFFDSFRLVTHGN